MSSKFGELWSTNGWERLARFCPAPKFSSWGLPDLPHWCYFTAVFFLLFRRLISEVTERISTKLGHIFTYDCYLKNLVRTPLGIYIPRSEGKNRFLWPILNFDQTCLCNGTWYQQSERNLSICTNSPTCPHLWWTLVGNGWERLASVCPPPQFSHWETLPALPHKRNITDSRQTLARVM